MIEWNDQSDKLQQHGWISFNVFDKFGFKGCGCVWIPACYSGTKLNVSLQFLLGCSNHCVFSGFFVCLGFFCGVLECFLFGVFFVCFVFFLLLLLFSNLGWNGCLFNRQRSDLLWASAELSQTWETGY